MKVCSQCSAENESGYRYCRQCGGTLLNAPAPGAKERAVPPTRVIDPRAVQAAKADGEVTAPDRGKRTMAYQPDRAQQRAHLHRVTAAGEKEQPMALDSTVTVIGREEGDLRFPGDVFLSNPHARLFYDDGDLKIEDLDSANGTFRRIRGPVPVAFGDTFILGHQALRLDAPGDALGETDGDDDTDERLRTSAYGRPGADYVACLSALLADGTVGSRYMLDAEECVLGRENGDIVFTRDPYVSNDHLAIRYIDGVHYIEDLGSENGTFVRVAEPATLDDDDALMLGRQVFIVRFE